MTEFQVDGKLMDILILCSKCYFHWQHCRELNSNNISGQIPKELRNITALVSLDLYQNNYTGTIPDSLGQLSNLRFLYVSFIQIQLNSPCYL